MIPLGQTSDARDWSAGLPLAMKFDAALSRPVERPAVFLDKDGTLVVDVPYNTDPARIAFTPGAPAARRA